jgi:deferrochelatase/peroxidase EfeB
MLIPDSRALSAQDLKEIQGLILRGTKLPYLRYHLLEVTDPAAARQLLALLVNGVPAADPVQTNVHVLRVHTSETVDQPRETVDSQPDRPSAQRLYVALTALGLAALNEPRKMLESFPKEFRQGARARASQLGDTGPSAPDNWNFLVSDDALSKLREGSAAGDPGTHLHDRIHIVVMLYAGSKGYLRTYSAAIVNSAESHGCRSVTNLDGAALETFDGKSTESSRREVHFRFTDGISQPSIMGIERKSADAKSGLPAVPPGMFVLGHHYQPDDPRQRPSFSVANEPVPEPQELGLNGSFGALRILEQDCDAFEEFLDRSAKGQSRELLAAKMCGRWRNGRPLTLFPTDEGDKPAENESLNDFDYKRSDKTEIDDAAGVRCPIGSHIRRANPRSADVLGQTGNLVRLIRRGMPYGPPHKPRDGKKRGMLGLFLCVSLKRQFEFIQKHWINDGLFARGLPPAERDPMVGNNSNAAPFTYSDEKGNPHTTHLAPFVTTKGAAYLFFPSVRALQFLSTDPDARRIRPPQVSGADLQISQQDRIDVVVANMLKRVGGGTRRDAHTKHHGVVRAKFRILSGLPDRLAKGVFAKPDFAYDAYMRFSNGSPKPMPDGSLQPDSVPDARGMAIKLLAVDGPKLMPDEKHTHDFVLASHPVFFTRDLGDYLRFLETRQNVPRTFPLLPASFKNHANPLTIEYFSQTPYALGPGQVVKYVAVPLQHDKEKVPTPLALNDPRRDQPNYLREAMAAHLSANEAKFAFKVQFQPKGANVDDATEEWQGEMYQVAEITIPVQEFRTERHDKFAENMSFSPWHCLEAHTPLGSINEARRAVYIQASGARHRNGRIEPREPDGMNDI